MATKADNLSEFFLQDDADVLEQPRTAPQPTSKPQLEDIFRGRRAAGHPTPILTLKNLQAERTKYKQKTANLKHGLSPIPEVDSLPIGVSSPHRFPSVIDQGKETEAASPTPATPRKFRGGSMSDRKRRDLSAEIANATNSALASVLRAETHMKSPSPHHSKINKTEDFTVDHQLDEESKLASPPPIPSVPISDFKPSKVPQTAKKESTGSKTKAEISSKQEVRKQPSQGIGQKKDGEVRTGEKKNSVKNELRARSISPMRSMRNTPSKPMAEMSVLGDVKSVNKKKKMTQSEASDLAKRLMSTSSAYERL